MFEGDPTWVQKALDKVVFLWCLDADEVHATFPAIVPGVEPTPVCRAQPVVITLPRNPVKVVSEPDISLSIHS